MGLYQFAIRVKDKSRVFVLDESAKLWYKNENGELLGGVMVKNNDREELRKEAKKLAEELKLNQ